MTKIPIQDKIIAIASILLFIIIIIYSQLTNFHYYIIDSLIFIILTLILLLFYRKLNLNTTTFFSLLMAFTLHSLGAFKFYRSPPVPFEWDIVTHFFGILAATLFIYNIVLNLSNNKHKPALFFIVILAAGGIGVMIEFVEFFGFMTTGFGEGFLGRGFGDFDPRIVSSDYLNTIQDLFWNSIGSLFGFVIAYFINRKKK